MSVAAQHVNPATVLLLSAGSPLVPDIEETCRRAGIDVRAIISDDPENDLALDTDRLMPLDALSETDLELPVISPLFTPGLRQTAYREFYERLGTRPKPPLAILLDPSSAVAQSCHFANGCYVNAGAVIGACSRFGEGCLVNRGCSLGHHLEIGDYVSFGPGAVMQGDVIVEKGAMIGTNATVIEYVTVGANSVVAAGAVVTVDVPPNTMVRGNPARIVKRDIQGYKDALVT